MKAYSKGITKDRFIAEIENHQKLDNFIKGTYSEGGKGCAVGCSIKSIAKLEHRYLDCTDHQLYEQYLGIPEWLAYLEDVIFEGLDIDLAKLWPLQFSKAINEGVDLDKIRVPFLIYILQSNIKVQRKQLSKKGLPKSIKGLINKVIDVIEQLIIALEKNDTGLIEEAGKNAYTIINTIQSIKSSLLPGAIDSEKGMIHSEYLYGQSIQLLGPGVRPAIRSIETVLESILSVSGYVNTLNGSIKQIVASAVGWSVHSSMHISISATEKIDTNIQVYSRYANKLLKLLVNCK